MLNILHQMKIDSKIRDQTPVNIQGVGNQGKTNFLPFEIPDKNLRTLSQFLISVNFFPPRNNWMLDPVLLIRDTPGTKHVFLDDKMTIVR